MAGMTSAGFTTKRLSEIISEQNTNAGTIFQDLVPIGDTVDTSESSTIGRIIGLTSAQFSDLWEALQEVYSAFDPNSATGIALDNLVALNGTTRIVATATTADIVVWAPIGTTIPNGVTLTALNNDTYETGSQTILTQDDCVGALITIDSVSTGDIFSLNITVDNETTSSIVTATASDTVVTILASLQSQLSTTPYINCFTSGGILTIESSDIYKVYDIDYSGVNITAIKSRLQVSNTENGALTLPANSITSFTTPINGVISVTNPFAGVTGSEEETDEELRVRFANNKYTKAVGINESLYSALIDVENVATVRVYENNTDDYVSTYDLPGHSFKPIVRGGLDSAVAAAIWTNQPLGISSEGNTSYTVTDTQGFTHVVKWERPALRNVYIDVSITPTETDNIPSNAASAIKASLISYFETLSFGEDVIQTRLYTPVNETDNFSISSIHIGWSASPTASSNLTVAYNELATVSAETITVNIV